MPQSIINVDRLELLAQRNNADAPAGSHINHNILYLLLFFVYLDILVPIQSIIRIFETSATCNDIEPIFIHLTAPFAETASGVYNVSVIHIDNR